MPNHWTHKRSIWCHDLAIPSRSGCIEDMIMWKIPIMRAYQYDWESGPVSSEFTMMSEYIHRLMVSLLHLML